MCSAVVKSINTASISVYSTKPLSKSFQLQMRIVTHFQYLYLGISRLRLQVINLHQKFVELYLMSVGDLIPKLSRAFRIHLCAVDCCPLYVCFVSCSYRVLIAVSFHACLVISSHIICLGWLGLPRVQQPFSFIHSFTRC